MTCQQQGYFLLFLSFIPLCLTENDLLAMVKKERQKYKSRKKQLGRRENREDVTLAMLAKFKNKLAAARTVAGDYDDVDEEKNAEEEEEEEEDDDMSW